MASLRMAVSVIATAVKYSWNAPLRADLRTKTYLQLRRSCNTARWLEVTAVLVDSLPRLAWHLIYDINKTM